MPTKKKAKPKVSVERKTANQSADAVPADARGSTPAGLSRIQIGNRDISGRVSALGKRKLDVLPDMPDIRDRVYQPSLRALHPAIFPRISFGVRDQGSDSSCTGFSLAHVIDVLQFRELGPDSPKRVSPRMLYEMAKRNDEWTGSAYEGSSIRGAIKGFHRNGVCSEATAPDTPGIKDWALTYEMAKEARETRLGAYFRLQPDISDYHSAINEAGVIYASAQIHSNWDTPQDGKIAPRGKNVGGHAFAIVGYNESGFWVLNSWGAAWGISGIAHWAYEDWAATVMDAWVLQLGVRAPNAFGATPRASLSTTAKIFTFNDPHRADIVGHFINVDDGRLVTDGKYGSPTTVELKETVSRLTDPKSNGGNGYDNLVIYVHGGLTSLADEAKRIATWKRHGIFSRNKLYNFHVMWGSGLIDEIFGRMSDSPTAGRMGSGAFDWLFEAGMGKELGTYAWRNMKQDARVAFDTTEEYGGAIKGLSPLLRGLDQSARRPKLHFVGHSAGAIVIGHLLTAFSRFKISNLQVGSIHLMAPACTTDFFKEHYGPYLSGKAATKLKDKVYLYNLTDELELDDTVSSNVPLVPSYSHSLLYLVSRAYEESPQAPLAGMQKYLDLLPKSGKLSIAFSQSGGSSESRTHGGFDNDVATMTSILRGIAGGTIAFPPTADELTGY
ncbi:C1 family peptidase [Bradyrhizobium yuanmingense]|uniref:C1 family peptidase n=1 Tax=Bradyrhizobium yuanmingense TaxID=108015 RepID=UPI0023B8C341|nr:C1 family peptidase [Bradyrhizobium yuanmingense]MDF0522822.1 C1 family peptidase [Bradyrhizobium yuanmingense]